MLDLTLLQLRVLWEISKKSRCGYELMKLGKKKITQGTMYPLLQSLEKPGVIVGMHSGTRQKKYYRITAEGEKVLKNSCKKLCEVYKDIFREYVCSRCKK
ncbi:MAG: PadR family transcriptional regulator [Candidatus Nanoarchaeia archaeon]|nr:PadR family transcriptional regulator [Candidatus Nanoarchaeia archaeon]MDD5239243.1 PadR family transcriptional regulator [Candidatus Nanoarchaeia archaeon]